MAIIYSFNLNISTKLIKIGLKFNFV